jgi:hypothetical protein
MHITDVTSPVRIDGGNARTAVKHECPLSTDVPVQLVHSARCEAHLDARHFLRYRQIADGDLTRPTSFFDPLMGKREGIFEGRLAACVGWRRPDGTGIFLIETIVVGPGLSFVRQAVVGGASGLALLSCGRY